MPLADRFRSFAVRVAINLVTEEDVKKFVRSYLVKRLKLADSRVFTKAIIADADLWGSLPSTMHNMVGRLSENPAAREAFRKYSAMINVDLVLKWLEGYEETLPNGARVKNYGDRPDLAAVVVNWPDDRARNWLARQIETIKRQFVQAQGTPPKIAPRLVLRPVGSNTGGLLPPGAGEAGVLRAGVPGSEAGPANPDETTADTEG